jgi:hypothetical protein
LPSYLPFFCSSLFLFFSISSSHLLFRLFLLLFISSVSYSSSSSSLLPFFLLLPPFVILQRLLTYSSPSALSRVTELWVRVIPVLAGSEAFTYASMETAIFPLWRHLVM